MNRPQKTPVTEMLNGLLGVYWTGYAQHQTHVALVQSWGLTGLATAMASRIADEPLTALDVIVEAPRPPGRAQRHPRRRVAAWRRVIRCGHS